MNLATFTRQRVRIERRFPAGAKRQRALWHLVVDAGAIPLFNHGRVTGWRLQCGAIVCAKRRYPNHVAAMQDLARIVHVSNRPHLPHRVYHCELCGGYHLTSQAKKA